MLGIQIRHYAVESIPKRLGHTKINKRINKALYNYILQHPQVVQYTITNDCLKVSIGGNHEPQVVIKTLLQLFVQELHNIMPITPE